MRSLHDAVQQSVVHPVDFAGQHRYHLCTHLFLFREAAAEPLFLFLEGRDVVSKGSVALQCFLQELHSLLVVVAVQPRIGLCLIEFAVYDGLVVSLVFINVGGFVKSALNFAVVANCLHTAVVHCLYLILGWHFLAACLKQDLELSLVEVIGDFS